MLLCGNDEWHGYIPDHRDGLKRCTRIVFSALGKNDFRVTKETFDYICQLVGPHLSRQNTRFRNAVALNKRVAIASWRLGTGNSYRTAGITFGQGKSTVIKIYENFMEALICHKDDFIHY